MFNLLNTYLECEDAADINFDEVLRAHRKVSCVRCSSIIFSPILISFSLFSLFALTAILWAMEKFCTVQGSAKVWAQVRRAILSARLGPFECTLAYCRQRPFSVQCPFSLPRDHLISNASQSPSPSKYVREFPFQREWKSAGISASLVQLQPLIFEINSLKI